MLAEHALNSTGPTRQALAKESGIGRLQRSLVKVAAAGKALIAANVVRAARTEFARLASAAAKDMKAYDPDPAQAGRLKRRRSGSCPPNAPRPGRPTWRCGWRRSGPRSKCRDGSAATSSSWKKHCWTS
ncbi:hypothetical protein GCM10029992_44910 [Glycomyces albus]